MKDCNSKELAPISLVCQTNKLYERMILNRIAPTIDLHPIKEQAGFRTGNQLLNISQQEIMMTGTGFVELSATKDTVHQIPWIM